MTKDDVDTIRNSQKYSENNKNNNKKSKNSKNNKNNNTNKNKKHIGKNKGFKRQKIFDLKEYCIFRTK